MIEAIMHNIGIGLGMVERHPFRIMNNNGACTSISKTIVSHKKNFKAVSECSLRVELSTHSVFLLLLICVVATFCIAKAST